MGDISFLPSAPAPEDDYSRASWFLQKMAALGHDKRY